MDIYPLHQTYLGFAWTENGVTKYFCFTVLPFGLTSSLFIFTKLLRPLIKYWRLKGLLIITYIDDGICISIGLNRATRNAKFVRDLGNISRLMTRHLYMAIESRVSWDLGMDLSDFHLVQQELKFWKENVTYLNCKKIVRF